MRIGLTNLPTAGLLGLAAALLIAPFVVLGFWEAIALSKRERNATLHEAKHLALGVRNQIDRTLVGYTAMLETLASAPEVDNGDLAALHARASAALQPLGLNVFKRDLANQQLMNTRRPYGSALPRTGNFDDPVRTTLKPFVSDIVKGAVVQRPVVGISVPVIRDGQLQSILTLSLNPRRLADSINRSGMPDDWVVTLLDRDGLRIARSSEHASTVGTKMPGWRAEKNTDAYVVRDENGIELRVVERRSAVSGWRVVVTRPEAVISTGVSRRIWRFVLVSVLLGLAAILGAYLLGRRIVSDLKALRTAARALRAHEPVSVPDGLLRETNIVGQALVDASDRRRIDDARIRTLMGEVQHRAKNQLSVIMSLTRRVQAADVDNFRDQLLLRLKGLAASHEALVEDVRSRADLRALVTQHLAVFTDPTSDRIEITGEPVSLTRDATQSIGLALHELATNAAKYGALSNDAGEVAVRWRVAGAPGQETTVDDAEPTLTMAWTERHGPPVAPPTRKGFGHTVVIDMIKLLPGAEASIAFPAGGVVWRMTVPVASLEHEPMDGAANEGGGVRPDRV
ncbi:MAG: sensor histidine kinase [Pseudomonadota bacterium]